MKKLIYTILLILATPIYIIIKILLKLLGMGLDLGQFIADGMDCFIENMLEFWKDIFNLF